MIRFFLTGILMQTPILSTTSEGTAISEFDIAIKRKHSQDNETDIFKTTVTGKIAESCCQHLVEGSRVVLVGRININGKYTDQNGVERTAYNFIVDAMEFDDSKQNSQTA